MGNCFPSARRSGDANDRYAPPEHAAAAAAATTTTTSSSQRPARFPRVVPENRDSFCLSCLSVSHATATSTLMLVGCEGGSLVLADASSGSVLQTLPAAHADDVTRIKTAGIVASASRDRTIAIWQLQRVDSSPAASFQLTLQSRLSGLHSMPITGLALAPQQGLLFSGSRDAVVSFFDTSQMRQIHSAHLTRNIVTDMTTNAQHQLLGQAAEDLTVRWWDLRNPGQIAFCFGGSLQPAFQHFPTTLSVSPDGMFVLVGTNGFEGVEDGCRVELWDLRQRMCIWRRGGGDIHRQRISSVCFWQPSSLSEADDPASWLCVSASNDRSVAAWDVLQGNLIARIDADAESDSPVTSLSTVPAADLQEPPQQGCHQTYLFGLTRGGRILSWSDQPSFCAGSANLCCG